MERACLVTGAAGFVGQEVCRQLVAAGHRVRAVIRAQEQAARLPVGAEARVIGDIAAIREWGPIVAGVDSIVHLAARVHQMSEREDAALRCYQAVNVDATVRIATAAAQAGIRRMVFASTIKVYGESTLARPFTAEDVPAPRGAYAKSKMDAEQAVRQFAASGLEVAIVRPPLVYGPGVRANFYRLIRLVDRGLPIPLGSVRNRRSLVSVWNLADLLVRAVDHAGALGQVLLVSDGQDVSLPDLLRLMARSMGRSVHLWRCPIGLLNAVATLTGKQNELRRLTESLQVDIGATQAVLGWRPPVGLEAGIAKTVEWYLGSREGDAS